MDSRKPDPVVADQEEQVLIVMLHVRAAASWRRCFGLTLRAPSGSIC